jgi:hypothetical protein
MWFGFSAPTTRDGNNDPEHSACQKARCKTNQKFPLGVAVCRVWECACVLVCGACGRRYASERLSVACAAAAKPRALPVITGNPGDKNGRLAVDSGGTGPEVLARGGF